MNKNAAIFPYRNDIGKNGRKIVKTEKKKGMKTMAAFILAMTMLAPLAACGGSPASSASSDGKGSAQESASSSVSSDSSAED